MIALLRPIYLTDIIYSLFIIFVFFMFKNVVTDLILKILKKTSYKYNLKILKIMIDAIEKPFRSFFIYTGFYCALYILPLNANIALFIYRVYRTCIIISLTQFLLNLVSSYSVILGDTYTFKQGKVQISSTIFPLLSKIVKTVIVIIALVTIAMEFEFKQLNSLLAGLGIGGAALALASQDLIKNFFGGFIVLTDKSFNVGDYIQIDNTVGTVEELGFRSTKIRTIGKELIVVPNSKFTDREVINYSNRENRRASFTVGITYNTPSDKIKDIIEKIKLMLETHPKILKDSVLVKLDGFGESSINIVIHYLTDTAVYNEFMDIKDDVNFNIINIFEEEGISFALPSRRVYLEKDI